MLDETSELQTIAGSCLGVTTEEAERYVQICSIMFVRLHMAEHVRLIEHTKRFDMDRGNRLTHERAC